MAKPVVNLDELTFDDVEEHGRYTSRRAFIGPRIGARKLGYNYTILPPGKAQCPFHNHRNNEEMFFILDGEGELRFGKDVYPLRANDAVACPPGGRDVAHQIVNTGSIDLRYLAVSTNEPLDICEYPDSDKMLGWAETPDGDFRGMFRTGDTVDYYDGEET